MPLGLATVWRAGSVVMLGWLAIFFGRTLVAGRVPLIERIARVSDPELSPSLARYTRRLTALWCVYFSAVALLALWESVAGTSFNVGAWVGLGSAALFAGEHRFRRWMFPGKVFPDLAQQVRDTWSIWHPRKRTRD